MEPDVRAVVTDDSDQAVWQRVSGPLSALIATLWIVGWHARYLDLWIPPDGDWYTLDPDADPGRLVRRVVVSDARRGS